MTLRVNKMYELNITESDGKWGTFKVVTFRQVGLFSIGLALTKGSERTCLSVRYNDIPRTSLNSFQRSLHKYDV